MLKLCAYGYCRLVVLVTYYGTCLDFNFETITLRLGPSNMIVSKLYSACFKPSKLAATNIFTEVMDRSNAAHINEKVIWMNIIHPNLRCRGWQDAPIFSKGRRQSRRTAADHVHEGKLCDLSNAVSVVSYGRESFFHKPVASWFHEMILSSEDTSHLPVHGLNCEKF